MFPPLDTIYAPQTLHRLDQGVHNEGLLSSDQELADSDNELEPSGTKQLYEPVQQHYELVEEIKPKYKHDRSVCLLCVVKYAPNRSQILRNRKISASSIHRTRTETESSYGGGVGNEGESPILVPWPQTKTPALTETTPASGESMATSHDHAAFGFAKALMDSSSQSRSSVRKELLRLVELMANPILFRTSKQGLLTIKQSCKDLFQDVCVYSDVCNILATCNHKLQARRFLQDLFIDSTFNELQEEPKSILSLSPSCSLETDDPTLAPPNTSNTTDSQRRDTHSSCDTDLDSNTKPVLGASYKTTTHDMGACGGGGGSELPVILEGDGGGGGGSESVASSCNTACGRVGGLCGEMPPSGSGSSCRKTSSGTGESRAGGICKETSHGGFSGCGNPSEADSRGVSACCSSQRGDCIGRPSTVCPGHRKQAEGATGTLGDNGTGVKPGQDCGEVWCPEERSDMILESCSGVYTSDSIDELSDETLFLKPCSSRLTLPLSCGAADVNRPLSSGAADVTRPLSRSSELGSLSIISEPPAPSRNISAPSLTLQSPNEAIVSDSSNASGTCTNTSTCSTRNHASNIDTFQNTSHSESKTRGSSCSQSAPPPQCLDQTIASSRRVTSAYIAAHTPPRTPTPVSSCSQSTATGQEVCSSVKNTSLPDSPVTRCSSPTATNTGFPSPPSNTSLTSHSPTISGSQHTAPLIPRTSETTDPNPSHPTQDSCSLQISQSASINLSLPIGHILTPTSGLDYDQPSLAHRIVPNIPSQSSSCTLGESIVSSSRLTKDESVKLSSEVESTVAGSTTEPIDVSPSRLAKCEPKTCISSRTDSNNLSSELDSNNLSPFKLSLGKSTNVSYKLSCEKLEKISSPKEISQSSKPVNHGPISKSTDPKNQQSLESNSNVSRQCPKLSNMETKVHHQSLKGSIKDSHKDNLTTSSNSLISPLLESTVSSPTRCCIPIKESERLTSSTDVHQAKITFPDIERHNKKAEDIIKVAKDSAKTVRENKEPSGYNNNISPTRISVEVVIEQIPRDIENDRISRINETTEKQEDVNDKPDCETIKIGLEKGVDVKEKLENQEISQTKCGQNDQTKPVVTEEDDTNQERSVGNLIGQSNEHNIKVSEAVVRMNTNSPEVYEDTVKTTNLAPIEITEEVVKTNIRTPIESSSPSHATKSKSKHVKTEIHTGGNKSPKKETKIIDLAKVKANKNNAANPSSKTNEASKDNVGKSIGSSKLPLVKPVKTETNPLEARGNKKEPSESKIKSTKNANVSESSQSKSNKAKLYHASEKHDKSGDGKSEVISSETSSKVIEEEIKSINESKECAIKNPGEHSIRNIASEQNTSKDESKSIPKPRSTRGKEKVSIAGGKKCSEPSETSKLSGERNVLASEINNKDSAYEKESIDKKILKIDLSARKSLPTTSCSSNVTSKSNALTARKSLPLSSELSTAKTSGVKPLSMLKTNGLGEDCRMGGVTSSIPQHSRKISVYKPSISGVSD
uniref:Rapamycin-insensitive companion of mTOR n=1 Tax=Cacopsylla melanoneura TaxID=428564 RepID=A0A8D9A369_9HEMI